MEKEIIIPAFFGCVAAMLFVDGLKLFFEATKGWNSFDDEFEFVNRTSVFTMTLALFALLFALANRYL